MRGSVQKPSQSTNVFSAFMTYHWVSLVEQELSILSEQLLFCGVHVTQSLVFCSVLDAIVWPLSFDRYRLTVIVWPLSFDRYRLAVIVWPLSFGRYRLAVIVWPLSFGRYRLAVIVWPLHCPSSIGGFWLLLWCLHIFLMPILCYRRYLFL